MLELALIGMTLMVHHSENQSQFGRAHISQKPVLFERMSVPLPLLVHEE